MLEAVVASVFLCHPGPYSETFRMVENVVSAFFDNGTVLADLFCFGDGDVVASLDEEQFGFAFACGPVGPVVEGSRVFGHS